MPVVRTRSRLVTSFALLIALVRSWDLFITASKKLFALRMQVKGAGSQ